MKTGTRIAALTLGLLQAATAGGAGAQTLVATSQRPPQAQCAAVRDIDFRALEREEARLPVATGRPVIDMLEEVRIPDWAARRPPEDVSVVIRARMPPGGGYSSDHRSVVWREADGTWWFWRHSVNEGSPAPPPPPPPPGVDRAEYDARIAAERAGRTNEELWWPPKEGRLSARQAAQMEAAWSDPCRTWDPDWWPHEIPLNRRIDGSRRRVCAQDSSAIFADMTEAGRPRRRVGGSCINATPTYQMIQIAAYASGEPVPR